MLFLVVEDEVEMAQNNCKFLKAIYSDAEFVIKTSPGQAREWLESSTPDLMVLDLKFKSASGAESPASSLKLLEEILSGKNINIFHGEYRSLNILIYSAELLCLAPVLGLINDRYKGGFAVADKLSDPGRQDYKDGVKAALKGELKLPKFLRSETVLTDKEKEVLKLMCEQCLSDKAIAEQLICANNTAKNYVQRIKEKLDIDVEDKRINPRVAVCTKAFRKRLITF